MLRICLSCENAQNSSPWLHICSMSNEAVMNWDDVRIFLAIQRAGTLRGAAQQQVVDQTTVNRCLTGL